MYRSLATENEHSHQLLLSRSGLGALPRLILRTEGPGTPWPRVGTPRDLEEAPARHGHPSLTVTPPAGEGARAGLPAIRFLQNIST